MIAVLFAMALAAEPVPVAEGVAAQAPSIIQAPKWTRMPSGQDLARAYPRQALRDKAGGRATMVCHMTAKGGLTDCRIVEETPEGMGFGEATLKMAYYFKMTPTTPDGRSVEGGTVRIPLIWRHPR